MFSKKGIKRRHSLAFRLTLWYAGIFSLSACIAFVFFYFLMTAMFRDQTDRDLYRQAGIFSTIMATDGVEAVKRFAALESQASGEKKIFYRLFYPTGISFSSSNMSYWQDIGVTRANIEQALQGTSQIYETLTIPNRAEQVRILYSNIGAGVILQLGQSLENVASFVAAFRKIVSHHGYAGAFVSRVWMVSGAQGCLRCASGYTHSPQYLCRSSRRTGACQHPW